MRPSSGSFPFTDENGTVWLAFVDWGMPRRDRVVICAHGLTRQGRDFDVLARAMATDCQVIEIDVAGRGRSGWLADKTAYNFDTYLLHAHGLMDYRGIAAVDWVGTSMGGIIGMLLAAEDESPIRRLVINDVGPFIPKTALESIGQYVGAAPRFRNLQAAGEYLREIHAGFGALSDADWSDLTIHSVTREVDGGYVMHYDPAIGDVFKEPLEDVDLWSVYDRIQCPVLVLRGADSEVLTAETAREMTERGPRAELVEFSGCGHAPALMNDAQVAVVHEWLQRDVLGEEEGDEEGDEAGAEEAGRDTGEQTQKDGDGDSHGAAG
ncbi:MAG: alpha/beta hydrolase [Proteobacteria bacterium]|nr:alpha/beta hydrolase [Pseudomonadota bacterium]